MLQLILIAISFIFENVSKKGKASGNELPSSAFLVQCNHELPVVFVIGVDIVC